MSIAVPLADTTARDVAPTVPLRTLSCVLDSIQRVNTSGEVDGALDRVAERMARDVPFDTFAVLLAGEPGDALTVRYARGLPDDATSGWRADLDRGLAGRAARERRTVALVDEPSAGAPLLPALASEIDFPLLHRDRLIGVLHLGARRADAFDSTVRELVEIVAGHLAAALENARLYADLHKQAQTLAVLHQASRELAAILDQDELLRRIGTLVGELIDYTYFRVMAWDGERRELRSVFSLGRGAVREETARLRPGQGIVGTAAALRRAVRVADVTRDPRFCQVGDDPVRSELAVPLLYEDRLIAVLDLESDRHDAFSADDERLLSTLAANVAVAMENAHLVARLRADEQRMAADMETARRVQRFLLPRETPWAAGRQIAVAYHPARDLGGDLYDIVSYDRDRTLVALGDVAGKGTGAALYGTLALGMLRAFAGDKPCFPECIFRYMDAELAPLRSGRRFLALAAALYDRGERTLTVASAGAPRPWLIGGGTVRELDLGGVPLGALGGAAGRLEWREVTVELAPGQSLVLVSDGVEECLDTGDRPLGCDRLREVLAGLADAPANAIADGVIAATEVHRGPRAPSDDRTVVVLKATDPSS